MKNLTKGALAASAATVLLLGGAGSLAYWTDEATVQGGSLTSGSLGIDAVGCDAAWVYADGTDAGTAITRIVPGDAITKTCTFTVEAVGDHLEASPTVPDTLDYKITAGGPAATLELPVSATYDMDGRALDGDGTITSADNGKTLSVAIRVAFPFGDVDAINANDTQGLTVALDDLTVTLTQDQTLKNPN